MAITSFLDNIFGRRKKNSIDFQDSSFLNNSGLFEFDLDTIRAATNEFSDLIGRGGFGSVYKGRLESGQEIAVKILSESAIRTHREFVNEVGLLSKLKHKNLINLLGFCSKRDHRCLVYEFMCNSSLDRYISDSVSPLNWEMCRNIIEGIARGLRYIHEESGSGVVVHRDINPTNILLDSQMKPKIAGFGLARLMQNNENGSETTVIAGTVGYLDPNYYITGRVSIKSDVYAFGITIMVIISRRKPINYGEETLIQYVIRCWNGGETMNVIHEVMREEERGDSISEILRYIHIALLCVDDNPETRPSLDEVLHWFSCYSTSLPEPTFGNQPYAEVETNQSLSPSLSPGQSSVLSSPSSRYGD